MGVEADGTARLLYRPAYRAAGRERDMSMLRKIGVTLIAYAWVPALVMGGMSVGCVHHHHPTEVVVDEHGYRHEGYYDADHHWHGGWYDEHNGFHDDPYDWKR